MKKIALADAASIAEVIGTAGVILSLVFVAYSINRNTDEALALQSNSIYESTRQIELMVAADAEWTRILLAGRKAERPLPPVEQYRFDAFNTAFIDLWDQLITRRDEGLVDEQIFFDWDSYYFDWTRRNMRMTDWARISWQYSGTISSRVEEALAGSPRPE